MPLVKPTQLSILTKETIALRRPGSQAQTPIGCGAAYRIRTYDPLITKIECGNKALI